MKENELEFIKKVSESPNNFETKLQRIIKINVLSQLSRPMLLELFGYYNLIDPKFNGKAVCMQCANSLFSIVKNIAIKYFKLKEEFEAEKTDVIEINLLNYANVDSNKKNENVDVDLTKEIIDPQLSLFEQDVDTVEVNVEMSEEKIEKVETKIVNKTEENVIEYPVVEDVTEEQVVYNTPKRGRPKSK